MAKDDGGFFGEESKKNRGPGLGQPWGIWKGGWNGVENEFCWSKAKKKSEKLERNGRKWQRSRGFLANLYLCGFGRYQ